jgi:hypothetical protein
VPTMTLFFVNCNAKVSITCKPGKEVAINKIDDYSFRNPNR